MNYTVTIDDRTSRTVLDEAVFARHFEAAIGPAAAAVADEIKTDLEALARSEMRPDGLSSSEVPYVEAFESSSTASGINFEAEAINKSPHREWVEFGSPGPRTPPPFQPIYDYLDAHGDFAHVVIPARSRSEDAQGSAIRRFVWAVVYKIARQGTPAKHIVEQGRAFWPKEKIVARLGAAFDRGFRFRA